MTTIIKATNAAHFLSLVPQLLGFTPARSLVLVPFAGSRSIGAMRFDLPVDDADVDSFASTCIGMVCRLPDAAAVSAVVYTDAAFGDDRPPRDELARALLQRADASGLRVVEALCVGADAWGSYVDPECPPRGRPLTELDLTPHDDLRPVVGDQHTGADLPPVDLAESERVGRALVALERSIRLVCGHGNSRSGRGDTSVAGSDGSGNEARVDPRALAAVGLLDDLPSLFDDALRRDVDALDPYFAAALTWCLARPSLRDIALVEWCGGFAAGDEALDAQLRWEEGEAYPDHIAERMWGEGPQPHQDRLHRALALTRRLAAAAPRTQRPGALAVCAWLSWALGRSTHAERYAAAALEIEPEHGLSEIVLSFVSAGHLPDWAFHRPPSPAPPRRPSRSGVKPKKKTAKRR